MPKADAAVVWGKIYSWVRMKDFIASIAQFYDEKGTLMRYMVYSGIKQLGGRTLPTVWTMHNKSKAGYRTEFVILDAAFDIPIPSSMFSFRELERGN